MTPTNSNTPRALALVVGALIVAAAGAGGMYLYLRGGSANAPALNTTAATPAMAGPGEIAIALAADAASRAGIQTARPTVGQVGASIAVPGVVEPNAYKQVVVRSVAAGQVRSVAVDLGSEVRRGDLLATIHSPELAETLRAYLSMRAEFDAAHQRQTRLEGLVKIGAASQQELETAKAEHVRHATDVESAQAKLALLGVTAKQLSSLNESAAIDSTIRVTSPIDGAITTRTINQGANIDASMDLFTVVDLSSVWVVANLYERDLSRVQVGSAASITSAAAPGRAWSGRVSYIDPQLAQDTRTAKVRIDVSNPGRTLRLGMYTDVVLASSTPVTAVLIPRTAIQTIGSQAVVYIADPQQAGRFLERSVALGSASGENVEVMNGVAEGDQVVVGGSFTLRAERDRLGLPPPAAALTTTPTPVSQSDPVKTVEIDVTKEGFTPSSVNVEAGAAVDLVFVRRTDDTCAKEVVVPSMNVRKALPLNERVPIRLPTSKAGTLAFACGMNMLKGTIVIR